MAIESDRLIDAALDSLFTPAAGGGGLLGLLGGLFGGGGATGAPMVLAGAFAAGGTANRSGSYLVGERGPEVVKLPRGAEVVPNHALRNVRIPQAAAAAAGGRSNTVTMRMSVDLTGANGDAAIAVAIRQAAAEGALQAIRASDKNFGKRLVKFQAMGT